MKGLWPLVPASVCGKFVNQEDTDQTTSCLDREIRHDHQPPRGIQKIPPRHMLPHGEPRGYTGQS